MLLLSASHLFQNQESKAKGLIEAKLRDSDRTMAKGGEIGTVDA